MEKSLTLRWSLCVLVLGVLVHGTLFAEPASWPRWRGPDGSGVSTETGWSAAALEGGARVLWTADLGTGYSNVAISGGRLYAMGTDDASHLRVSCLDAATGELIWKQSLALGVLCNDPLSTPAVDGDRLYGIAKNGALFCLDTADGSMRWHTRLGPQPGTDIRILDNAYGIAGSPSVDGRFLLLNANAAGIAVDKMDGRLLWDSGTQTRTPTIMVFASPIVADLQGKRTAICIGPSAVSAVDEATGTVLWSVDHNEGVEMIADPVIDGSLIYFSTGSKSTVLHCSTGAKPSVLWTANSLQGGVATPVLVGGYLYGTDWDRWVSTWNWRPVQRLDWPFKCVELRTGKVAWTRVMKWQTVTAANGKLIMLSAGGILTIAEASPKDLRVISSADVFAGANKPRLFVTPPVLCDGRIYCRNYAGDLVCIDAKK